MSIDLGTFRGPGTARVEEVLSLPLEKVWPGLDVAVLAPDGASGWGAPGTMTPLLRFGLPVREPDAYGVRGDFAQEAEAWLDAQPGSLRRVGWFGNLRLSVREEDGAVLAYLPASDFVLTPRPEPSLLLVSSSPAALAECAWRELAFAGSLVEHSDWAFDLTGKWEWRQRGNDGPPGEDVLDLHVEYCEAVLERLDAYDPGVVTAPDSVWRGLVLADV